MLFKMSHVFRGQDYNLAHFVLAIGMTYAIGDIVFSTDGQVGVVRFCRLSALCVRVLSLVKDTQSYCSLVDGDLPLQNWHLSGVRMSQCWYYKDGLCIVLK